MKEIILSHNYQWYNTFDTGIKRDILDNIIKALSVRHIIAISGARRSGKSYIFKQIIEYLIDNGVQKENIFQINFEDPFFISSRNDVTIFDNIFSEYLMMKNPAGKDVFEKKDNLELIPLWVFVFLNILQ